MPRLLPLCFLWKKCSFIKIIFFCRNISIPTIPLTDMFVNVSKKLMNWFCLYFLIYFCLFYFIYLDRILCYIVRFNIKLSKAFQNCQSVQYFKIMNFSPKQGKIKLWKVRLSNKMEFCIWFCVPICAFEFQGLDSVPTKTNRNLSLELSDFKLIREAKRFFLSLLILNIPGAIFCENPAGRRKCALNIHI